MHLIIMHVGKVFYAGKITTMSLDEVTNNLHDLFYCRQEPPAEPLTPGWTTGNKDLFKMPINISPLRRRPNTRRYVKVDLHSFYSYLD